MGQWVLPVHHLVFPPGLGQISVRLLSPLYYLVMRRPLWLTRTTQHCVAPPAMPEPEGAHSFATPAGSSSLFGSVELCWWGASHSGWWPCWHVCGLVRRERCPGKLLLLVLTLLVVGAKLRTVEVESAPPFGVWGTGAFSDCFPALQRDRAAPPAAVWRLPIITSTQILSPVSTGAAPPASTALD
uniref:Uncharacterized protein n=1 Tax=Knipowitschia caucasica TaxID=637954 RepID=A0AAV2JKE2_KNICA